MAQTYYGIFLFSPSDELGGLHKIVCLNLAKIVHGHRKVKKIVDMHTYYGGERNGYRGGWRLSIFGSCHYL
jgi:hypothetical protein